MILFNITFLKDLYEHFWIINLNKSNPLICLDLYFQQIHKFLFILEKKDERNSQKNWKPPEDWYDDDEDDRPSEVSWFDILFFLGAFDYDIDPSLLFKFAATQNISFHFKIEIIASKSKLNIGCLPLISVVNDYCCYNEVSECCVQKSF